MRSGRGAANAARAARVGGPLRRARAATRQASVTWASARAPTPSRTATSTTTRSTPATRGGYAASSRSGCRVRAGPILGQFDHAVLVDRDLQRALPKWGVAETRRAPPPRPLQGRTRRRHPPRRPLRPRHPLPHRLRRRPDPRARGRARWRAGTDGGGQWVNRDRRRPPRRRSRRTPRTYPRRPRRPPPPPPPPRLRRRVPRRPLKLLDLILVQVGIGAPPSAHTTGPARVAQQSGKNLVDVDDLEQCGQRAGRNRGSQRGEQGTA